MKDYERMPDKELVKEWYAINDTSPDAFENYDLLHELCKRGGKAELFAKYEQMKDGNGMICTASDSACILQFSIWMKG